MPPRAPIAFLVALSALALVSSAGPPYVAGNLEGGAQERKVGFVLAQRAPWLLALIMRFFRNPGRNPERFLDHFSPEFPQVDRDIQSRPEIRAMFLASYAESARQGVRAFADEVALVSRPWGFSLADIRVPAYVWHGGRDVSMPIAMGRYLAGAIPGCRMTFLPEAGHLLLFDHWPEILSALLSADESTSPSTNYA